MFDAFVKRYWHSWVDKRSATAQTHRLHHKNLYIFPTATGWAFLLLALVIWLLGTNYQNNLILALSYLQLSLLVMVILNTYNNLSGLVVECLGSDGGYVGEMINFKFQIASANTFGSHYVKVAWRATKSTVHDFEGTDVHLINVGIVVDQRGRYRPPRLLLKSDFPMGLVKCWTWLRFTSDVIVYPRPIESLLPSTTNAEGEGGGDSRMRGDGEEFFGYQPYRPGDALRHIAWKQYARERGLHTKLYGSTDVNSQELNWHNFFRGDVELAISQMTFWSLALHTQNCSFSVSLPSASIALGHGDAHLASVLNALALHGTN